MQFEPKKPAHGTLTQFSNILKNLIAANPLVSTEHNPGRINKRDAAAFAFTTIEVATQRQQGPGHQFDKPIVTDQVGKFISQMLTHIFKVVGFEIAIM